MKAFLIGLFLGVIHYAVAQTQGEWELEKEKNGISVYTKEAGVSGFKPFKGVVILNNTLEEFVSVLFDVDNLKDWVYETEDSKLIKKSGDTLCVYYAETNVPFPYTNRNGVYQNIFQWNSKTKTLLVTIKILDKHQELNADLVAISGQGYWQATVLGSGKLEVVFVMNVDPGGEIPAWMANMFVVDSPYVTLLDFREVVNKPQYKGKRYGFIN